MLTDVISNVKWICSRHNYQITGHVLYVLSCCFWDLSLRRVVPIDHILLECWRVFHHLCQILFIKVCTLFLLDNCFCTAAASMPAVVRQSTLSSNGFLANKCNLIFATLTLGPACRHSSRTICQGARLLHDKSVYSASVSKLRPIICANIAGIYSQGIYSPDMSSFEPVFGDLGIMSRSGNQQCSVTINCKEGSRDSCKEGIREVEWRKSGYYKNALDAIRCFAQRTTLRLAMIPIHNIFSVFSLSYRDHAKAGASNQSE